MKTSIVPFIYQFILYFIFKSVGIQS